MTESHSRNNGSTPKPEGTDSVNDDLRLFHNSFHLIFIRHIKLKCLYCIVQVKSPFQIIQFGR